MLTATGSLRAGFALLAQRRAVLPLMDLLHQNLLIQLLHHGAAVAGEDGLLDIRLIECVMEIAVLGISPHRAAQARHVCFARRGDGRVQALAAALDARGLPNSMISAAAA